MDEGNRRMVNSKYLSTRKTSLSTAVIICAQLSRTFWEPDLKSTTLDSNLATSWLRTFQKIFYPWERDLVLSNMIQTFSQRNPVPSGLQLQMKQAKIDSMRTCRRNSMINVVAILLTSMVGWVKPQRETFNWLRPMGMKRRSYWVMERITVMSLTSTFEPHSPKSLRSLYHSQLLVRRE